MPTCCNPNHYTASSYKLLLVITLYYVDTFDALNSKKISHDRKPLFGV